MRLTPGVAITGLDTQDGTWQYSPDGGVSFTSLDDWQDIGAVSDTSALLLDSSDSIRFVPNQGYFGDISDAITFRLWDGSSGTSMNYVDVSDNGGVTAFSADVATAALQIDPLVSITGGGGSYTISTTSAVPAALDVSGTAGWDGDGDLPFTVVIPAGQSSTTLNLSTLAGLDIDSDGASGLTVQLADPGEAEPGGYVPTGFDYAVDPSASSVSTTVAANPDNQPGAATYSQSGNTIEVTLDNTGGTAAMSWSTADGTAIAGTDYQSASGSVPAGQSQVVDITLDNLDAAGDSGFYIVTSTPGSPDPDYAPVIIQTLGLQVLDDANNDGRIDAEADATTNSADVASGSGGEFVVPNPFSTAEIPTPQLIATDQLIEIPLNFNAVPGTSITLTARGDTGDFVVWAGPSQASQITVTGAGSTWPANMAPTAVWISSSAAGNMTLIAQASAPGVANPPQQKVAIDSSVLRLTPAAPGQAGVPSGPNGQVNITSLPGRKLAANQVEVRFNRAQATGDLLPAVSTLTDLATRLTGYNNGSINVLTVAGHGVGGIAPGIAVGTLLSYEDGIQSTFTNVGLTQNNDEVAQILREKLAPNAIVVLYGCELGTNKNEVQQLEALAGTLGHVVYACTGPVTLSSDGTVSYRDGDWFSYTATSVTAANTSLNPQLFGRRVITVWDSANALNQMFL